jgi:hypothetical protein
MAIKVGGTTVINDSRALNNITSVDATTVAALGTAGVGAGGGKFTATADGAIASGKPVALQANGTVKQIAEVVNDIGTPTASGQYTNNSTGGPGNNLQSTVAYFPSNGYFYYAYVYGGSNAYINKGTYSVSAGEAQNLASATSAIGAGDFTAAFEMAYSPSRNTFAILVMDGSLKLYMYYSKPDGTVSGPVVTQVNNIISSGDVAHCITCDEATGNYHVAYNSTSGYNILGSIYSPSIGAAPNYTVTVTTVRSDDLIWDLPGSHQDRHMALAKDESTTSNFMLIHKRSSDDAMQMTYYTHNSSGVSNVGGALYATGQTTSVQDTALVYNPTTEKFIASTNYNNVPGLYLLLAPTTTGGNPTVSGTKNIYSNQATQSSTRLVYDPKTTDVLVMWWYGSGNTMRVARVDSSGTSITVGTNLTTYSGQSSSFQYVNIIYLSNENVFLTFNRHYQQQHELLAIKTTNTTNNSSTWIGFSEAAISSGQAGDILVLGSVSENQSSLTTGTTYYVNGQGSLVTGLGIKAGRALSATKLLITEGNA